MIGYLDKDTRPLVLIMPKMSRYVKTLKVEDRNNKLMSFGIDDTKILEKHKATWPKIESLKNTELNALPVYDDRYIKTIIKTYSDKVYTNFRELNVPEDDIEWECFTGISIDFLLVYEKKYYLQVYLDNCHYKIGNKQMIILMKMFSKIRYYTCSITIEFIYAKELIWLIVTTVKNI